MLQYVIVSVASGILFGVLDGVINANPLARKLYEVYQPIAKTSVNAIAGVIIDLLYGFVMAAVFSLLYASLPGQLGIVKGLSFAALVWFFRAVMSAASTWMMFRVPARTIAYGLMTALVEMLVLGILYGLTLRP
jgi:tRNA A37 threonylcarbamoyladenosine synthetase subunit TsaC/SUA5/YrdC